LTHGIFDRNGLNWIIIKSRLLELCLSVYIGTVLLSVLNAVSIGVFISIYLCQPTYYDWRDWRMGRRQVVV